MSWLFGYGKPNSPDNGVSVPPPPQPPPNKDNSSIEDVVGAYRFDSAALERAAKAAHELESSKYAKDAFDLSNKHEQTLQIEYQSKMKEYELGIEQMKNQHYKVQQEERRKTLEEEARLQKQRADYQDVLARKRQEDQLAYQAKMQAEALRKQEESVEKQEKMRRSTIGYEADLRHQNEMKQIEARIRGEAQAERENRDLRLERSRIEAGEHRKTVVDSITTVGSVLGRGFDAFLSERDKIATVVGSLTVLAGGIYGAKYGMGTLTRFLESRIGKPSLVRETSRFNVVDSIRHPITTMQRIMRRPTDPLAGIILAPRLEGDLRKIGIATRHTKANGGFYRNVLMAGPPGTGKTMFAKSLAVNSGMDYAILTGGDIAPLGNDGVTSIHKVFDWTSTSRKGVLLFVDEADAFLRKREQERISEGMRATLNAFLYRTGEQSKKFMLVLASNQPEQFDWAINDRMDEIVQFDLPGLAERERLVRHYFDAFLLKPSLDKKQRIRLDSEIDYASACTEIAARTDGLSGREISKVAIAWQTAAFASEDGVLTRSMMDSIVDNAIAASKKKREWRHHRLPSAADSVEVTPTSA